MNAAAQHVFIVDDDPSVRSALARLLESEGWTVEVYESAEAFLARPPFDGTGCVLLDVQMPGMHGPQLQRALREGGSLLPVVFLTGGNDVKTGVDAIKDGAVDFLLKATDGDVLIETLHRALKTHEDALRNSRERAAILSRIGQLTPRERAVMEFVIRGLLNKQIAEALDITVATVKVHRGRVMDKMNARSVADLVRQCEAAGLFVDRSTSPDPE